MSSDSNSLAELILPTEKDFGGCLDAKCAWKHFGGLDLNSAYKLFCENPLYYQEDFMFMGIVAFQFYFPVVDRFLRDSRNLEADGLAWILAKAICMQLESPVGASLLNKIESLCNYVRTHLPEYSELPVEMEEIGSAWAEVERRIAKLKVTD